MNTMRTADLKVLVIGSGSIGRRHMRNLRSLGIGELAACDPDPERLAPMVTELNVLPSAASAQAIEAFRPDAVLICTPPSFHLDQAEARLHGGRRTQSVYREAPSRNSMEGVQAFPKGEVAWRKRSHIAGRLQPAFSPRHPKAKTDCGRKHDWAHTLDARGNRTVLARLAPMAGLPAKLHGAARTRGWHHPRRLARN